MAVNEHSPSTSESLCQSPLIDQTLLYPPSHASSLDELRTIRHQLTSSFVRLATETAQLRAARLDLETQRSIVQQQALYALTQVRGFEQEATRAVKLNERANATLRAATTMRQDAERMLIQAKQERLEMATQEAKSSSTARYIMCDLDDNTRPTSISNSSGRANCDKALTALPKHISSTSVPAGRCGHQVPLLKSRIPMHKQNETGTLPRPPGFHVQPSRDQRIANLIACDRALDELELNKVENGVSLRKPAIPMRKQDQTESVPPPPGFKSRRCVEQRRANLIACQLALNKLDPTKAGPPVFPGATTALAPLGPVSPAEPAPKKIAYTRRLVDTNRPPPPFILRRNHGKLVPRKEMVKKGLGAMGAIDDPFTGSSSGSGDLPERARRVASATPLTGSSRESDSDSYESEEESPSLRVARRIATKERLNGPQVPYVSTKRHQTIYLRPTILPSPSSGNAKDPTITPDGTPSSRLCLRWRESFSMPEIQSHTITGPFHPRLARSHTVRSYTKHNLRTRPHTPSGRLIPSDLDRSNDSDADDELDDSDDSGPIISGFGILNRINMKDQSSHTPPGLPHPYRKVSLIPRKMSGPDEVYSSSDNSSYKSKKHVRNINDESNETVMPEAYDSDQLPVISPGASDSSFGAGSSLMSEDLRASTRRWIGCVPKGKRPPMPALRSS